MQWQLTNRRGRPLAAGSLTQMYFYLKNLLPDGEYKLKGDEITIATRRFRGKLVYPPGLEDYLAKKAAGQQDRP